MPDVTLDFSKAQPIHAGATQGVTLDFTKSQPIQQQKPTPVVEGSLSANKQPEGWFQQAQEDLQQGGSRTILGRTLGHLQGQGDKGYTGLQSGTSKGAAEIVGSPATGALHIAEGYATNKPLKVAQGTAEASTLPGMMAVPGGAEGAVEALPSAKHAGHVLNEIEMTAAKVPVNLAKSQQELQRLKELSATGHGNIPAINKLIKRTTTTLSDIKQGKPMSIDRPLTYEEARDFYKAITRLTVKDSKAITPAMKRQLGAVASALKQDIGDAAGQVGESARYYASMKEYARAKRLASVAGAMTRTLGKYGVKAVLGAAGAGAAGALGYEIAKGALKPAADNMPGGTAGDLSVLPESFQKTLEGAKVSQGKPTNTYGTPDIATVEEGDPKNITVRDPARMSAPVLAHETTHLEQSNWDPKVRAQFPKDDPNKPYLQPEDLYKFPAMRQKGMTAKDLPEEHQAQVMQAYTQYPSMRKMLQPWVDDMAKFKKSNVLPTGPEDKSINTTPRAPEAPDWAYQPIAQ